MVTFINALKQRGLDWIKDNLEEVVKRGMAVKIKVIEEDPYEKGVRAACKASINAPS